MDLWPHLGVRAGVGDDQQAGLAELLGDLVGEGTGGEAARDGQAPGVLGELEHRALAVRAGGDGNHVLQIDHTNAEGAKRKDSRNGRHNGEKTGAGNRYEGRRERLVEGGGGGFGSWDN